MHPSLRPGSAVTLTVCPGMRPPLCGVCVQARCRTLCLIIAINVRLLMCADLLTKWHWLATLFSTLHLVHPRARLRRATPHQLRPGLSGEPLQPLNPYSPYSAISHPAPVLPWASAALGAATRTPSACRRDGNCSQEGTWWPAGLFGALLTGVVACVSSVLCPRGWRSAGQPVLGDLQSHGHALPSGSRCCSAPSWRSCPTSSTMGMHPRVP